MCYILMSAFFLVVTSCNVRAYDHYVNGIYYKTSAGLTNVPTDIPPEARQVQLYNNAIGNSCAKGNAKYLFPKLKH